MTTQIKEGELSIHHHVLGPQTVKVLTVNRMSNIAVVQFRELDQPASAANTRTVVLNTLRTGEK